VILSTSIPAQSIPIPYSNLVPGSLTSGILRCWPRNWLSIWACDHISVICTHDIINVLIGPAFDMDVVPGISVSRSMRQQHSRRDRCPASLELFHKSTNLERRVSYLAGLVLTASSSESTTTGTSLDSGTYCPTGASRSKRPRSTSCMQAIPVTILVHEKTEKTCTSAMILCPDGHSRHRVWRAQADRKVEDQ
jgi:hypothetical protein